MIDRLVAALSRWSLRLAAAGCLSCLALVCYAVARRYFFGRPEPWADEAVAWLMVLTVMLAAPEAQRRGEHVAVDSFVERARRPTRRALIAFGVLTVAATAAILIYEGWAMVAFSRMVGMASNVSGIPLWWIQTLVPLGFALLLIVALAQLARMARGAEPTDAIETEGDAPKLKAGPLE